MTDQDGSGEARTRQRERQVWWVITASLVTGLGVGVALARSGPSDAGILVGAISTEAALALAFVWLAVILLVGLWQRRIQDELTRGLQQDALAVAANATFLCFPPWYLLSRADLLPELPAGVLFVFIYAVFLLGVGLLSWRRFR